VCGSNFKLKLLECRFEGSGTGFFLKSWAEEGEGFGPFGSGRRPEKDFSPPFCGHFLTPIFWSRGGGATQAPSQGSRAQGRSRPDPPLRLKKEACSESLHPTWAVDHFQTYNRIMLGSKSSEARTCLWNPKPLIPFWNPPFVLVTPRGAVGGWVRS